MTEQIVERAQEAMDRARGGAKPNMKVIGDLLGRGMELADERSYAKARDAIDRVLTFLAETGGPPNSRGWAFALGDAAPRFALSVYMSEPLPTRAEALAGAIALFMRANLFNSGASLDGYNEPLFELLARTNEGPLPELDAFLPSWIEQLSSALDAPPTVVPRETWQKHLDEARGLSGGSEALADEAREEKSFERLEAWTLRAFKGSDKQKAFDVLNEAAALAPEHAHLFLDQAARVAQLLGADVELAALEAAFRAKPESVRTARWLLAGDASPTEIQARAAVAHDFLGATKDVRDDVRVTVALVAGAIDAAVESLRATESLDALALASVVAARELPDGEPGHLMQGLQANIEDAAAGALWVGKVQYYDEPALRIAGAGDLLARSGVFDDLSDDDQEKVLSAIKASLAKNAPEMALWKAYPFPEFGPEPDEIGSVAAKCLLAERARTGETGKDAPDWVDDLHRTLSASTITKPAALSLRKQTNAVLRSGTPKRRRS